MNSNIFLLGFEDVTVTLMEEVEEKLCIHVERSVEPHTCPVCHSVTQKIHHDYRIQKIKHLKMFERQTLLFYRRRPYFCPCGKMKLLLNEAIVPREKIQKLFIFIDHILELPENETEKFVKEISPLIEKEDFAMALTMDDTSFARYYKKIGREEGRLEGKKEGKVEGKKETALKLLEMGISMDVIEKATGLEKEEIEKLNKG